MTGINRSRGAAPGDRPTQRRNPASWPRLPPAVRLTAAPCALGGAAARRAAARATTRAPRGAGIVLAPCRPAAGGPYPNRGRPPRRRCGTMCAGPVFRWPPAPAAVPPRVGHLVRFPPGGRGGDGWRQRRPRRERAYLTASAAAAGDPGAPSSTRQWDRRR